MPGRPTGRVQLGQSVPDAEAGEPADSRELEPVVAAHVGRQRPGAGGVGVLRAVLAVGDGGRGRFPGPGTREPGQEGRQPAAAHPHDPPLPPRLAGLPADLLLAGQRRGQLARLSPARAGGALIGLLGWLTERFTVTYARPE